MQKDNNPKLPLLSLIFALTSLLGLGQDQQIEIHGVVTGADDQILSGVSVVVKGSNIGVTTDENGTYKIKAKTGNLLRFSFVGYQVLEVKVTNNREVNVQLDVIAKGLNEVVVLGYGTQVKRDLTASVSSINVNNLKEFSISNATQLIQGTAPGVVVKQTNGAPGGEFQVMIRGVGSLGASSAPLYVIDGFPIGNVIGRNLTPNDIESISILKDAVSTAIYGARGANGVVLITTKKAKTGKTNLSINGKYGITNVPDSRRIKVLNGPEFAEFKKSSFMDKIRFFENREPDIDEIPEDFRFPEQTKISTDWFKEILHQNAPFQDYNVSYSHANNNTRSLISASYLDQQGALIKSNFRNYSLRANMDGKFNDFLHMGLNISVSHAESNWDDGTTGRDAIVGRSLLVDPREPVYNDDGSWNLYLGNHDGILAYPNPVMVLHEQLRRKNFDNALAIAFVEVDFFQRFRFRSSISARYNFYGFREYVPSIIGRNLAGPPPRDASETDLMNKTVGLSADQLLTYSNKFKEHNINLLVGYSAQKESIYALTGSGSQYPDDLIPYLGSAAIRSSASGDQRWSLLAYFTRVNYSYKGKYLFSGTLRREGSSRFGELNKYGTFPALSGGWRISDEPFFPKAIWIQDLKFRASWGETGNNNIGNYSSLAFMGQKNYILGGNFASGLVVGNLANSVLKWERNSQIDIGADLTAFDGSLFFTADYYKRITKDMLLPVEIPATTGFNTVLDNVGKVQNSGFEFTIGYNKRISQVEIFGNLNFSINRSKVLEILASNDEILNIDLYGSSNRSKVGRPIGMLFGFKTLGIFQNQLEIDHSPIQEGAIPGSFKYLDADGSGTIEYDPTDWVEIGNPWPKFTYGFSFGGSYKNFNVSVLLTGAYKYDMYATIQESVANMDGVFNIMEEAKYRWRSEANPGKNYWPTTNFWKWERESNSRYVHDASHLWVKDITVGYTLPEKIKLPFRLKVFASVNNFLLFTRYPGTNVEADDYGGTIRPGKDDSGYPIPRTYIMGVSIQF